MVLHVCSNHYPTTTRGQNLAADYENAHVWVLLASNKTPKGMVVYFQWQLFEPCTVYRTYLECVGTICISGRLHNNTLCIAKAKRA